MYSMVVPQLVHMLQNLKAILGKAAAYAVSKEIKAEELLEARLIDGQFPLTRQIQSSCDNAKFIVARLSGQTAPSHPDNETTIEQLQARIDATIAYVQSVPESAFHGWEERRAEFGWLPGKYMKAYDYLVQFGLPNFYFHVTTAYSILRHKGVELGKMDFLGADLPFHDK
jgi:uncharacterized protein